MLKSIIDNVLDFIILILIQISTGDFQPVHICQRRTIFPSHWEQERNPAVSQEVITFSKFLLKKHRILIFKQGNVQLTLVLTPILISVKYFELYCEVLTQVL